MENTKEVVQKLVDGVKRKFQGLTYCRPHKKGQGVGQQISTKRCPDCGFIIRGPNHIEGPHHKKGSEGEKGKAKVGVRI